VHLGELLSRSDADGGVSVRFALPDPDADSADAATSVLEAFPGCTVTIEDMFDVAQDFITACALRARADVASWVVRRSALTQQPPPLLTGPCRCEPRVVLGRWRRRRQHCASQRVQASAGAAHL
jgi:hypothetical protein